MKLLINTSCNLSCAYCFASEIQKVSNVNMLKGQFYEKIDKSFDPRYNKADLNNE